MSAGAGVATIERRQYIFAETGNIAVPAYNRKRGTSSHDPRSGYLALGSTSPKHKRGILRRPRLANRSETCLHRKRGILDAHDYTPLVGINRLVTEIPAGVTGQMDVEIDKAGKDGFGRKVYNNIRSIRDIVAAPDFFDLAVFNHDDGRPRRARRRIGN